jgi:hypothetical protein
MKMVMNGEQVRIWREAVGYFKFTARVFFFWRDWRKITMKFGPG